MWKTVGLPGLFCLDAVRRGQNVTQRPPGGVIFKEGGRELGEGWVVDMATHGIL